MVQCTLGAIFPFVAGARGCGPELADSNSMIDRQRRAAELLDKLALELEFSEGSNRYDGLRPAAPPHGVCERWGRIEDVDLEGMPEMRSSGAALPVTPPTARTPASTTLRRGIRHSGVQVFRSWVESS